MFLRLDVPGDHVKPVYLAAIRLRMDRAAAECAKFLANHLDLVGDTTTDC